MKRYLCLSILFISFGMLSAQNYNKSIGLRGGISSGFEYRFFTDDVNSYKLLLSTRNGGFELHALKEFHQFDLFEFSNQLVFFFGAGAHVGSESWDVVHYNSNSKWYDTRTSIVAGLDGLAGLEYVFYEFPISAGVEVKPYFDLFGREVFNLQLFDFAFTIKYLF